MIHDLKDNCIQPKLIDKRRDFRVEDEAISDSVVPLPLTMVAELGTAFAEDFSCGWVDR